MHEVPKKRRAERRTPSSPPTAEPSRHPLAALQRQVGNASLTRALRTGQLMLPVQRHIEQVEQAADRSIGDLTSEDATRMIAEFAAAPGALARFGPRRCLLHLLREVEAGGRTVTRAELDRRSARYVPLVVVRPDGYWTRALTGEALQRAFPPERLASPPYEIGAFHYSNSGVIYRTDDSLLAAGPPVAELGLEHDVVDAALDGVEDAVVAMARGLRELITHPIRTIAGLANLPGAVAQLIVDSPEYWAHFQALPLNDQVRKISELVSTLVLLYGTAAGSATTIAGAAADIGDVTVNVLRLQSNGTLAVARVSVPVGAVATAMSGGPGAIYVLSMANNAAGGSGGSGGGSGGRPPNPPEFLQAVRDLDTTQASRQLTATERGALEWNAEQIATKTARPNAVGEYPWQSLWKQLQRGRWKFLNQAPEAARTLREMINRLPAAGRDPNLPDRAALLAELERWLSTGG